MKFHPCLRDYVYMNEVLFCLKAGIKKFNIGMIDIKLLVYNRFPPDLLEYIRDLAHGSPKQIYDRIMRELADYINLSFCHRECALRAVRNRVKLTEEYLRPRTPYRCLQNDWFGGPPCDRPVAIVDWENTGRCSECGVNDYHSYYHRNCPSKIEKQSHET